MLLIASNIRPVNGVLPGPAVCYNVLAKTNKEINDVRHCRIRRTAEAIDYLITGLRRLEYRGYDSSGVALVTPQRHLTVCKSAGRIDRREASLAGSLTAGPNRHRSHPLGYPLRQATSMPTPTWAVTARLPSFTTG